MTTHDITFELTHEPLNRADAPADWGDYIPVLGEALPAEADPACPPTLLELAAADAFDRVFLATGDVYAADAALRDVLCGRNGHGWAGIADEALDACDEGDLPVAEAGEIARTALERADVALPAQVDKSDGIMFK
jgi:hypothetical protein